VFGVAPVGRHFPPSAPDCATADCRQVNIYVFDDDSAVSAFVNLDSEEVVEVYHQPGVRPGINKRLADRAIAIAIADPDVIEVLGFEPRPEDVDMAPVDGSAPGTSCDGTRLCVAPTFELGEQILWVFVDLKDEVVAGLRWTNTPSDMPVGARVWTPEGCVPPGSVNRDGWTMEHEVTGSDGLRLYDVSFNGRPVLTSVKLMQWHADYGGSGYQDSTGCGGGGGFPIYPYGVTEQRDLLDDKGAVIGFELVQDFRMGSWGNFCNYRYEQHLQFFPDGRFRVVGGAYGKGCGTDAMYRPLVRIDPAVNGDDGDNFSYFDGSAWLGQPTETWRTPYEGPNGPHFFTDQGFAWRVSDDGDGYFLEPGRGQFADGGRGDDPFLYAVLHHPEEGDTDLGVIGSCCNDDHQQGPHIYVNGESIADANVVLWYVPQMITDAYDTDGDGYYCWTLQGEPNPETYPCFSGPMFVPVHADFSDNGPVALGSTAVFTDTSIGAENLTYQWDFGDGLGGSTAANPSYVYQSAGTFTVTLTVTTGLGYDTVQRTFTVLEPAVPLAGFSHNSPIILGQPAIFTNTTVGDGDISYIWDFGDGTGMSTEVNPTYLYTEPGDFTVTLTATNSAGSNSVEHTFVVLPSPPEYSYQTYVPLILSP
jgi:hypothetical protein